MCLTTTIIKSQQETCAELRLRTLLASSLRSAGRNQEVPKESSSLLSEHAGGPSSATAATCSPSDSPTFSPTIAAAPTPNPCSAAPTTTRQHAEYEDEPSSMDRFLQGYTKFMANSTHQDHTLKLLQYSLWMTANCVFYKSEVLQSALMKHAVEVGCARYVLRWLALPSALEAVRSGSWGYPSAAQPAIHNLLGRFLALTMVGYYPLEHAAYLEWKTPLFHTVTNRVAETLSAWSCACWLAYLVAEICQCWLKLREELDQTKRMAIHKKTDDHSPYTTSGNPSTIRNLQWTILRNLLLVLPALHWSLPNSDQDPLLSLSVVYPLMWLEAVVRMLQTVVNFCESS